MEALKDRVASSKVLNDFADYMLYYRYSNTNDTVETLDDTTSGYIEFLYQTLNDSLNERVKQRYNIYKIEKELQYQEVSDMTEVLNSFLALTEKIKPDELINPRLLFSIKLDITAQILLRDINDSNETEPLPANKKDFKVPLNFDFDTYSNDIRELYDSTFNLSDRKNRLDHSQKKLIALRISELTDNIMKSNGKGRNIKKVLDKEKVYALQEHWNSKNLTERILEIVDYIEKSVLGIPNHHQVGKYNTQRTEEDWTEEEKDCYGPYAGKNNDHPVPLTTSAHKPSSTTSSASHLQHQISRHIEHSQQSQIPLAATTAVELSNTKKRTLNDQLIQNSTNPHSSPSPANHHLEHLVSEHQPHHQQHSNKKQATASASAVKSNNLIETNNKFQDKYAAIDPMKDIIPGFPSKHVAASIPISSSRIEQTTTNAHHIINDHSRNNSNNTNSRNSNVHNSFQDHNNILMQEYNDSIEEDDEDDEDEDVVQNTLKKLSSLKNNHTKPGSYPKNLSDNNNKRLSWQQQRINEDGTTVVVKTVRKRKFWTEDEIDTLHRAVQDCGMDWATIRDHPEYGPVFARNERTNVDLKDKWRNITKPRKGDNDDLGPDI